MEFLRGHVVILESEVVEYKKEVRGLEIENYNLLERHAKVKSLGETLLQTTKQ